MSDSLELEISKCGWEQSDILSLLEHNAVLDPKLLCLTYICH